MAEDLKRVLGKVAFVDKGVYSSATSYSALDFVTTEDSCYLSLQDGNKGHAVTDAAWWKCIANGKPATEAAKKADAAATAANNAVTNANGAAQQASQAAEQADTSAEKAESATQEATEQAGRAETAADDARSKIADMDALGKTIASYVHAAPVRMKISLPESISTKNKVRQKIGVRLYPSYVMKNVLYQRTSGTSAFADPSGNLSISGTGQSTFYVIPTQNTELWQEVSVTVREPLMRLTGEGKIRLNGDKIRIV